MIIVPDDPGHTGPEEALRAIVRKVFDGDGFMASVWHPRRQAWIDKVQFRFAFIDAPEMAQPFGQEARDFLAGLIAEKELCLELIGKESTGYMPIDPYKRVLCVGYLTEQMEVGTVSYYHQGQCGRGSVKRARPVTRNIELEMIVNGWAWVVQQYTFVREAEYFEAQDDAQRHRRGLWAADDPEPPWNFKRRQRSRSKSENGQGRLI